MRGPVIGRQPRGRAAGMLPDPDRPVWRGSA